MKTTPETTSPQLALLKKHFANCFDKHGNFIPAKLQEIVQASGVTLSKEGYSLNWLGKSYARLLANENIRTLLKADTAHNAQPANATSQNLLIKGDNLEVLKHLMGAYSEQVKMIYIDPPYNTGSDGFVYQDDRKFTAEQLSGLAGIDEDEAKRILEFTSSSSNSHSAWLTFMYPRLYLAKQLLRDDGVIFISIDDNEQAQLKVLCDEVFGEENSLPLIVRRAKVGGGSDNKHVAREIDYVFGYASHIDALQKFLLPHTEKDLKRYSQEDEQGKYFWDTYSRSGLASDDPDSDSLFYEVKFPDGSVRSDRWRRSKSRLKLDIRDGDAKYVQTKNGWNIHFKQRLNGDGKRPRQVLYDGMGNVEGTEDIESVLPGVTFSYPKPVSLIKHLTKVCGTENSIILDFFAGSGTTAHAVMQLNAEDNGSRQFICIQIDEPTDPKSEAYKAGYKTIFDITQARVTRAAAKIKAEYPAYQGDLGYKVFETLPMFDKYLDSPDELTENLELFDVNTLSQDDRHNLMLTWALRDGIKLGASLAPVTLGDYTAYAAGKTLYFVEPDVSLDAVVALLEQLDNNPDFSPSSLVVLGYLLDSKAQREMTEAVKHYNNRKGIELTLDIRYN